MRLPRWSALARFFHGAHAVFEFLVALLIVQGDFSGHGNILAYRFSSPIGTIESSPPVYWWEYCNTPYICPVGTIFPSNPSVNSAMGSRVPCSGEPTAATKNITGNEIKFRHIIFSAKLFLSSASLRLCPQKCHTPLE